MRVSQFSTLWHTVIFPHTQMSHVHLGWKWSKKKKRKVKGSHHFWHFLNLVRYFYLHGSLICYRAGSIPILTDLVDLQWSCHTFTTLKEKHCISDFWFKFLFLNTPKLILVKSYTRMVVNEWKMLIKVKEQVRYSQHIFSINTLGSPYKSCE